MIDVAVNSEVPNCDVLHTLGAHCCCAPELNSKLLKFSVPAHLCLSVVFHVYLYLSQCVCIFY